MKNSVPEDVREKQSTSCWLAKKHNFVEVQDAGAIVHLTVREDFNSTKTSISTESVSL